MSKIFILGPLSCALALMTSSCEKVESTNERHENTQNEIHSLPSHYEQLKDLDWLIGEWQSKDAKNQVTATYLWDTNKNFLIEHFKAQIEGQPFIEGQQIIGWNPVSQKIRSWIFDSDGGFGKSIWMKTDDSWYTPTKFILPDGRKATATHIYKKVDNNTFTFVSESRDIDGNMMPNIGPNTMIRKN